MVSFVLKAPFALGSQSYLAKVDYTRFSRLAPMQPDLHEKAAYEKNGKPR